jgi:hypothetical protein
MKYLQETLEIEVLHTYMLHVCLHQFVVSRRPLFWVAKVYSYDLQKHTRRQLSIKLTVLR